MGCDIHAVAERRVGGVWTAVEDQVFPLDEWEQEYRCDPFHDRNYAVFGFLAGVRNYSGLAPIAEPRGFPKDASGLAVQAAKSWDADGHSHSHVTLAELLAVDYDAPVEDRRITVQTGPNSFNGGATAAPGGGQITTLRERLGSMFMSHLDVLASLGAPDDVRVVFWFDN